MKNYLTQPFLSFFISLVICIPHSSHSVSISHTLHKRMEMAASGAEAAKILEGGTDVSKSNVRGSGGIKSTKQMKNTGWFGLTPKSSKEGKEQTHLGQGLTRTTWWEKVVQMFKGFKSKLSKIHQNFLEFLGFKKFQYDRILKESLNEWQSLRKEDKVALDMIWKTHKDFSAKIKPMLLLRDKRLDPMQVLVERMAPYQSKSLEDDQEILRNHLPRDRQYLSTLLGSMGPEKVLEPWFQAVIKKKVQSKELEFFRQEAEGQSTISKFSAPEEEFLSELKNIETNLANLAISQRTLSSSVMGTKPELALRYKEDIAKNEEKLTKLLGGREKMKSALEIIFSMDFHKTFMKELKSPSSLYYYDLVFLEPFRYLNYDIKAEEKKLIYQQLGIESRVDHILTIMHQAPIALENFKTYLKIILR